tara:strand:- start:209 stop:406 length:198 start_codon:yes stop_codon:yes gene_type:complete
MEKNSRWLERELAKDKREIIFHKSKTIRDILNTPKEEITKGPQVKKKKKSKWTQIKDNLKRFFKL